MESDDSNKKYKSEEKYKRRLEPLSPQRRKIKKITTNKNQSFHYSAARAQAENISALVITTKETIGKRERETLQQLLITFPSFLLLLLC